jgi:hypothetical protein
MYDHETADMEDLEALDHELIGGSDGETWDNETGLEEAAGHDLESFALGETGLDHEDLEADPFLGGLIRRGAQALGRAAKQGGVTPAFLKQMARQAATVAGGAVAGRMGAGLANQLATQVLRESDLEGDYEGDGEGDYEAMGGDPEVLEEMNYTAAMAAETDNEQEADQFLGALAGLAGPLLRKLGTQLGESESDYEDFEGFDGERDEFLPLAALAAPQLAGAAAKAAPLIGKGIKALGRLFRRRRSTRPAVRALPRIAANTAARVAQAAQTGRPVTPCGIAQAIARETAQTIGSRPRLGRAMQANRASAAAAQARPQARGRKLANGMTLGPMVRIRRRGRMVGYIPVYTSPRNR